MKTIADFPNSDSFAEIYQKVGLYFFFVTEKKNKLYPLHNPVVCRDFLNDAVFSTHLQENLGKIWGFGLDGTQTPVDTDKARMILKFGQSASHKGFEELFQLLNDMESSIHFELSEFEVVKGSSSEPHYYITGDRRWVQNGLMISIWTHLLRMLSCESSDTVTAASLDELSKIIEREDFGTNSAYCRNYNNSALDLTTFLRHSDDIFARYNLWGDPTSKNRPSLSNYHDNSGLQRLITCFNNRSKSGLCSGWAEEYRSIVNA